ncbi:hypothetical protein RI367_003565 [Sorochytrium milnesiophthora]
MTHENQVATALVLVQLQDALQHAASTPGSADIDLLRSFADRFLPAATFQQHAGTVFAQLSACLAATEACVSILQLAPPPSDALSRVVLRLLRIFSRIEECCKALDGKQVTKLAIAVLRQLPLLDSAQVDGIGALSNLLQVSTTSSTQLQEESAVWTHFFACLGVRHDRPDELRDILVSLQCIAGNVAGAWSPPDDAQHTLLKLLERHAGDVRIQTAGLRLLAQCQERSRESTRGMAALILRRMDKFAGDSRYHGAAWSALGHFAPSDSSLVGAIIQCGIGALREYQNDATVLLPLLSTMVKLTRDCGSPSDMPPELIPCMLQVVAQHLDNSRLAAAGSEVIGALASSGYLSDTAQSIDLLLRILSTDYGRLATAPAQDHPSHLEPQRKACDALSSLLALKDGRDTVLKRAGVLHLVLAGAIARNDEQLQFVVQYLIDSLCSTGNSNEEGDEAYVCMRPAGVPTLRALAAACLVNQTPSDRRPSDQDVTELGRTLIDHARQRQCAQCRQRLGVLVKCVPSQLPDPVTSVCERCAPAAGVVTITLSAYALEVLLRRCLRTEL